MKWFFLCWRKYAQFKGRARRKEYWWFTLIMSVIFFLLLFILSIYGNAVEEPKFSTRSLLILMAILMISYVPAAAVMTRRLHDIGKSGKWTVTYIAITMIVQYLINYMSLNAFGFLILLAYIVFNTIFIIWLARDSQPGDNPWGPNPKASPANVSPISNTVTE